MILGVHVSTAGGVSNAPLNACRLGISTFQIFTKTQNRWKTPPTPPDEIDRYLKYCEENGIQVTLSHDAYLINLCSTDNEKMQKSREAFIDEMDRADLLQMDYLVMHPGSHLGAGEDAGLKLIAESLAMCFDQRPDGKVRILLETTAGQGTNLGYRFEQIAELIHLVDCDERIGVCVDTCHIFAAGYDFSTPDKYRHVFEEFDRIVGLDRIYAFHFNDSKKNLGSRVDRHEHIGEGLIGSEPFRFLMDDDRFRNVPAILETPGGLDDHARNLNALHKAMSVGS